MRQRKLERWAADRAPLIAEALRLVGHVAIRNRGTAVGNLAHGDPASSCPRCCSVWTAPSSRDALATSGSSPHLSPPPGSAHDLLAANEILAEARFTLPPAGAGWGFAEVARRHGDFALAGCAALLWRDGRDASPERASASSVSDRHRCGERRRKSAARSRADAGPVAGGGAGGRGGAVPLMEICTPRPTTAGGSRGAGGTHADRRARAVREPGMKPGGSPRRQRAAARAAPREARTSLPTSSAMTWT